MFLSGIKEYKRTKTEMHHEKNLIDQKIGHNLKP